MADKKELVEKFCDMTEVEVGFLRDIYDEEDAKYSKHHFRNIRIMMYRLEYLFKSSSQNKSLSKSDEATEQSLNVLRALDGLTINECINTLEDLASVLSRSNYITKWEYSEDDYDNAIKQLNKGLQNTNPRASLEGFISNIPRS